ncbi:MAG: phytanoyl-CoA dioxygenase family protein [Pseudomonadota bacterium]
MLTALRLPARSFSVVDMFSAEELAAMGAAIHETVDSVAKALRTPYEESAPALDVFHRLQSIALRNPVYATAFVSAVFADAHRDPRIAFLADDGRLQKAVAELCGDFEPGGVTVRVRLNIPAMTRKRHGWHSDVALTHAVRPDSTCHTVLAACWIPLADVDENNGGLELVTTPLAQPIPHERTPAGAYFIPDAALEGLPRQPVAVRAGQAAIIDRFTPHRSLPNTSDRVRWSVVAWVKGSLMRDGRQGA